MNATLDVPVANQQPPTIEPLKVSVPEEEALRACQVELKAALTLFFEACENASLDESDEADLLTQVCNESGRKDYLCLS